MIEDKKKGKAFPTFLLLLAIILIGLGVACQFGYLDPVLEQIGLKAKNYDSTSAKKKNDKNTDTIEENALKKDDKEVVALYNKISNIRSKDYMNIYYQQDSLEIDKTDNKFKLLLAFNNLSDYNKLTTVNDEDMKKTYSDIFGNIEYKGETFDSNCREFVYNSESGSYTTEENASTCVLDGCKSKKEEILGGYKDANKIEIKTVVSFVNTCDKKYYKDYKYSSLAMEGETYKAGIIEKNQDKFDKYIYTFTLTDGSYVFTKVAKVV